MNSFPGMLFGLLHPHNPPFLLNEKEFNKKEFPILMTDPRVFDPFVEWVIAAKFDQITGLPLDGMAHVDHMHGSTGYVHNSKDG